MVKLSETVPMAALYQSHQFSIAAPILWTRIFSFRVGKSERVFESSSLKYFLDQFSSTPWVMNCRKSYDGNISARSGAISNDGSTSTGYKDDIFKGCIPSVFITGYHLNRIMIFLSFKLNDVEVFKKSGETPWIKTVVAVKAGLNKMEWIYRKDNSMSEVQICAWIDMIDFTQSSSLRYIREISVARVIVPVNNEQYGVENISVKFFNVGKDT